MIVLVPYLMTIYFHGMPGKFSGGREDAGIEQKVIQMVAAEMSGHYETEALKAQAVCARTYAYRQIQANAYSQYGAHVDDSTNYQENQEENLETITFCVEETAGEILTWKGEAIDAAYHAVSSGNTRNAAEVSGQEGKDYLQSVESRQDISSMEYLNIIYMEKQEMAQKLQGLLGDAATVDAEGLPDSLTIEARDSAGYVTRVRCGSVVLNGEAVRDALGLSSSCFYFSQSDGKIRITCKGEGHGLGLSQYGANELAKEGKNYREILKYYYQDVKISK
mgnify:CR=1 FL=1